MVESLSMVEKLRLGMATLFLHRPPVIFLDEPTAGLDPMAAMRLRESLGSLIDNRPLLTVFLTTDNQADAARFCERVAIFHEGKIVNEGTPAELGLSAELPRLRLAGEGFNPTILNLLIAEPEVDQAEINEEDLLIKLNAGIDLAYLTGIIEEAGAKIHGVFWDDNRGDILASLIQNDTEKAIKPKKKEEKTKENGK